MSNDAESSLGFIQSEQESFEEDSEQISQNPSPQPEERVHTPPAVEEASEESMQLSEEDLNEIKEIVRKKVQIDQIKQQKKLDELEANFEEKLELKHNWRNKARSKLEILNQIKLGTDQTISILPHSLNQYEQQLLSMSKAQRFNNTLIEMRKQLKARYKDYEHQKQMARATIHDNSFPSNHIPLYLQSASQSIIVPPQNLLVRKGTVEQFIKLNLENEPILYQQQMERRMGLNKIQKRKPYQKRIKPE